MDAGVRCPRCSRGGLRGASYCPRCGYDLRTILAAEAARRARQARGTGGQTLGRAFTVGVCFVVFAVFLWMLSASRERRDCRFSTPAQARSYWDVSGARRFEMDQGLRSTIEQSNRRLEAARREAQRVQQEVDAMRRRMRRDDHATSLIPLPAGFGRVVYICDASASMGRRPLMMEGVKQQLRRSLNSLRADQQFAIIFFQDGVPRTMSTRLLPASAEYLSRASSFIDDVEPQGRCDPRMALRLAQRMEPQLIYFVTAGDFDDPSGVLRTCEDLPAWAQAVRYSPIAILGEGKEAGQGGFQALERIAGESGGTVTYLSETQLDR